MWNNQVNLLQGTFDFKDLASQTVTFFFIAICYMSMRCYGPGIFCMRTNDVIASTTTLTWIDSNYDLPAPGDHIDYDVY